MFPIFEAEIEKSILGRIFGDADSKMWRKRKKL